MLHELELQFIQDLHQFRNPLFDHFFKFLDFFDRQEFFFILIPMIWLGSGWKSGLRLFYILLLSSFMNHALKDFFLSPRPFHLDASLRIIQVGGLGFPSGAAQSVILLSGLLLTFWKSSWKWAVAVTYIALVSFSRIYLGVHFPIDILGGWVIGFCLLAVYFYIFPLIERRLRRCNLLSIFALSCAMPILLLIWKTSISTLTICSVAIGLSIGLFVVHSYRLFLTPSKNWNEFVLRGLIGVLGTFACYLLTNSIPYLFPRFLLLGLWVSLGSPLLCRQLFANSKTLEENYG